MTLSFMGLWVSDLNSFFSKLCREGKEGLLKKLCPLSLTLTHSQLKLQPWCVSACACYWEPPLLYSSTAQYQRLISINILYELSQNLVKGESNGGRKEDSSSLFSKGNAFQKRTHFNMFNKAQFNCSGFLGWLWCRSNLAKRK